MADSDMKTKIHDYFKSHHGEVLYPSDVAEALDLDYEQVKKAIEALERDGAIGKTSG